MNAKQEAKFTMFKGVKQLFNENLDIISTVAALLAAFESFKEVIDGILGTEHLTSVNLSVITVDKSNAKNTLCQLAADIAAIITAFASATDNPMLEAEVNYTFTKLKRARSEQLAPICQIIHDRGIAHKSELADYGLTVSKLGELQTAIAEYAAKTPNPRNALSNRITQSANRRELFKRGDTILTKQIDGLIKNFRQSNPDLCRTYQSIRELPDTSTTTTQLKGIITDKADGKPIKGATITIVEINKTATTDSKGEYSIKPVEFGKYTVTVTKEGYQPYENDELEIKMGSIKHLDIKLTNI